MGHIFERELKGILQADRDMLARVTRTCDERERESYFRICERPFMVIRAAGSLGMDLVAITWKISFPIEVKSSSSAVLRFSRSEKLAQQAQQAIDDCVRAGLVPLYAFRLKGKRGDSWRVFSLNIGSKRDDYVGFQKLVYDRLPKVAPSKDGNLIMRWNEGMPLSKFIDYLGDMSTPREPSHSDGER
jgi:Holliday junction resolvase